MHQPEWEQLNASTMPHLTLSFRHSYGFRRRVPAFLRLPMGSTARYQPLHFSSEEALGAFFPGPLYSKSAFAAGLLCRRRSRNCTLT